MRLPIFIVPIVLFRATARRSAKFILLNIVIENARHETNLNHHETKLNLMMKKSSFRRMGVTFASTNACVWLVRTRC